MVQWLRLHASTAGGPWFDLRSHRPRSAREKKKRMLLKKKRSPCSLYTNAEVKLPEYPVALPSRALLTGRSVILQTFSLHLCVCESMDKWACTRFFCFYLNEILALTVLKLSHWTMYLDCLPKPVHSDLIYSSQGLQSNMHEQSTLCWNRPLLKLLGPFSVLSCCNTWWQECQGLILTFWISYQGL